RLVDGECVSAMAHITGGGITENLPRVLPRGVAAVIEMGSWQVPPIFEHLQHGNWHAAGCACQEVQEGSIAAGTRGRESLHGRSHRQRRPQGYLYLDERVGTAAATSREVERCLARSTLTASASPRAPAHPSLENISPATDSALPPPRTSHTRPCGRKYVRRVRCAVPRCRPLRQNPS